MLKQLLRVVSMIVGPNQKVSMLKKMYRNGMSEESVDLLEKHTLQFDVAHVLLMDMFSIHIADAKSFQMVRRYLHRDTISREEENKVKALLQSRNARRAVYTFMLEVRDITPHQVHRTFPTGDKREQFEQWLDGKISNLS